MKGKPFVLALAGQPSLLGFYACMVYWTKGALRTFSDCSRWTCRVTQPVQRTTLWPASWLPAIDKSGGSKSVEVRRVWEVYDERLQFISSLGVMLCVQMSLSMQVTFLVLGLFGLALLRQRLLTLIVFFAGPIPSRGLVLGRGSAVFRVVRLGGHKVRTARGNAADVFLFRDSYIAPLLDMRRRFKAVWGILDAMIRTGVSLYRSVELTAQWDTILAVGPLYPVTLDDLTAVQGLGIGDFHQVVSDVHNRLSYFIHAVVVHRRD